MSDDDLWLAPSSYRGFFPRDPSHPGVWMLEGLRRAIGRFRAAATPTAHPLETFIPLFEALNWIAMIDDGVPQSDSDSPILKGLRFARNVVHHQWADALQLDPGSELGVLMIGVSRLGTRSRWLWRQEDQLPRSRTGRHGHAEYVAHLQGQEAVVTLRAVLAELAVKLPIDEDEPKPPRLGEGQDSPASSP